MNRQAPPRLAARSALIWSVAPRVCAIASAFGGWTVEFGPGLGYCTAPHGHAPEWEGDALAG